MKGPSWISRSAEPLLSHPRTTPSTSTQGSVTTDLYVLKKYHRHSDVAMLDAINFKRSPPSSPILTRLMLGKVSPSGLSNHAIVGIKYSADLKPNSGFKVSAESNQVQEALNRIVDAHQRWSMDGTGDIKLHN